MRGAKHRVDVDVGDLRFLDWATIDWRSGGCVHIVGRFGSVDPGLVVSFVFSKQLQGR